MLVSKVNYKLAVLCLCCVLIAVAKDLVVGTRVNNLLISTQKAVYKGIPLIRRDKDYVYSDPKQRIIKLQVVIDLGKTYIKPLNGRRKSIRGIIARDLDNGGATADVTAGGIGQTNVTLHFKSERGSGLNYLILIFSNNV